MTTNSEQTAGSSFELLLRALLKNAFREANNTASGVEPILLSGFHGFLCANAAPLFQNIPETVSVTIDELRVSDAEIKIPNWDASVPLPGLIKELLQRDRNIGTIKLFDEPGLLIDDGLHASGFGTMKFIYRAKGMRTFWFKSGIIRTFSVYCTIDENGFELSYEKIDELRISPDTPTKDVKQCFRYFHPRNNTKTDSEIFLDALCCLNKPFDPAYFIEYLFPPPDVRILSDFSQHCRVALWKCVLDDIRASAAKGSPLNESTKYCLDILSRIEVAAPSGELIDLILTFLRNGATASDLQAVVAVIADLRDRVVPDSEKRLSDQIDALRPEVVELKPNIAGIGINFGELLRRIQDWFRDH
jgi:hypothetical protein